jgi:hypothetical protein
MQKNRQVSWIGCGKIDFKSDVIGMDLITLSLTKKSDLSFTETLSECSCPSHIYQGLGDAFFASPCSSSSNLSSFAQKRQRHISMSLGGVATLTRLRTTVAWMHRLTRLRHTRRASVENYLNGYTRYRLPAVVIVKQKITINTFLTVMTQ